MSRGNGAKVARECLSLRERILAAPPWEWETTVELIHRLNLPGLLSSTSRALGELVEMGVLESRPVGVGRARVYRVDPGCLLFQRVQRVYAQTGT